MRDRMRGNTTWSLRLQFYCERKGRRWVKGYPAWDPFSEALFRTYRKRAKSTATQETVSIANFRGVLRVNDLRRHAAQWIRGYSCCPQLVLVPAKVGLAKSRQFQERQFTTKCRAAQLCQSRRDRRIYFRAQKAISQEKTSRHTLRSGAVTTQRDH